MLVREFGFILRELGGCVIFWEIFIEVGLGEDFDLGGVEFFVFVGVLLCVGIVLCIGFSV